MFILTIEISTAASTPEFISILCNSFLTMNEPSLNQLTFMNELRRTQLGCKFHFDNY